MNKQTVKHAFIKSLPVMAGYIVLGIGFGMVLYNAGYGVIWAIAMSVFIYAGSMQFAGVSLITSGAPFIDIAVTTLLVNARHIFYGIAMIDRYKGTGIVKPYLIHSLTDETFSLVCNDDVPDGCRPTEYRLLVSVFNHVYWVLGSAAGSLLGSVLPISSKGIEFSMTALFVTVVVDQWLNSKDHSPTLIGFFASVLCLIVFGTGSFLLPSMALILILLFVFKRRDNLNA